MKKRPGLPPPQKMRNVMGDHIDFMYLHDDKKLVGEISKQKLKSELDIFCEVSTPALFCLVLTKGKSYAIYIFNCSLIVCLQTSKMSIKQMLQMQQNFLELYRCDHPKTCFSIVVSESTCVSLKAKHHHKLNELLVHVPKISQSTKFGLLDS